MREDEQRKRVKKIILFFLFIDFINLKKLHHVLFALLYSNKNIFKLIIS